MTRLPIPGSDDGSWGTILNAFLSVAHDTDGSLLNGSITSAKLDSATQTTLSAAAGKYTKPSGGIPASDLASAVQTDLTSASTAVQSVNTKTGTSITLNASDVGAASVANITQLKAGAVYVEDYGAVGNGTTDDTTAINNAISAAVTAAASGNGRAEVRFQAKTYLINGSPIKGGAAHANAIIPLPLINSANMKINLVLRGEGSAAYSHWDQTVPQLDGTVFKTTTTSPATDGTYGDSSMVGAAKNYTNGSDPNDKFSNLLVTVRGLRLVFPKNSGWVGMDLAGSASADIDDFAVIADVPAVGTAPNLTTAPTNSKEIGLIMPGQSNNDISKVGDATFEGIYYGISISEHFNADKLGFLYCNTGIFIGVSGVPVHGAAIRYIGGEYTKYPIWAQGTTGSSQYPFWVGLLDCEQLSSGGNHVHDPNNVLYGEIGWADYQVAVPSVSGGSNVKVKNWRQSPGAVTAPTVSATTVALQNPFWRDAYVRIVGGTVSDVAVDGQSQGATPGMVALPSGKTITLTYSAAPTWSWILF